MRITGLKTAGISSKNQSGFTLIELSIVITIIGFLMVPLANAYKNHLFLKRQGETRDNIASMSSEIISHLSVGRLPCPSDRSLPPTDANYGVETDPLTASLAGLPACTGGMQGICRAPGARDTDVDVDVTPDPVIIGGIPSRSLRDVGSVFGETSSRDSWGNQLTYAVSASLCAEPDPMNPNATNTLNAYRRGVIEAVDEFGNPTAGIGMSDLSNPPDATLDPDGQFVVISHGQTGAGAFSASGSVVAACSAGTADSENCDNDSRFIAALGSYKGNIADFYDDEVYFHLYKPSDLWNNMSVLVAGNPVPTQHIRNLNDDNVGILTNTPAERLHVDGNIQAASVKAPNYCKDDGSACFWYDFLGTRRTAAATVTPATTQMATTISTRNTCGVGEVIITLGNNTVTCGRPALQPPATIRRCPAIDPTRPYLRGIMSNGEPICTN